MFYYFFLLNLYFLFLFFPSNDENKENKFIFLFKEQIAIIRFPTQTGKIPYSLYFHQVNKENKKKNSLTKF